MIAIDWAPVWWSLAVASAAGGLAVLAAWRWRR